MRRAVGVAAFLVALALFFTAEGFLEEGTWEHTALSIAGGVAFLVCLVAAWRDIDWEESRLGWHVRAAKRLTALDRRLALRLVVGGSVLLAGGLVVEWAEVPPWESMAGHLQAEYRPIGTRATPYGDSARVYAARGSPTRAAADLEEEWPAEDQRYTPAGVFLRYEDHVVGVLPGASACQPECSHIWLEEARAGFRHFHRFVGDLWGDSYRREAGVIRSGLVVPSDADARRLVAVLGEARNQQEVCYGWDIDVRSGEREGRFVGSDRGVGIPVDRRQCDEFAVVEGWLDPNAHRFARRRPTGDWSLRVIHDLPIGLPQDALAALDTPFVEMIEGATTEPAGGGSRAGKGVFEHISVLPLLVAEAGANGFVSLDDRPTPTARDARPAAIAESDRERRAQNDWWGRIGIAAQMAGGLLVVATLLMLAVGFVRRGVRNRHQTAR